MNQRRLVRDTSQRRRHEGLSAFEVQSVREALAVIVQLLQAIVVLPFGVVKIILIALVTTLYNAVSNVLLVAYVPLDRVDATNKNRLIASFSESECFDYFRFHRDQLMELARLLELPPIFECHNGCHCPGEHALCVYLFHLSYPMKLQRMQNVFGREQSQLSRIENCIKAFLIARHRSKVVGNLDWYADRFDMYRDAYNRAIAYAAPNGNPGTIPPELLNIVGSVDGTSFPVARIKVLNLIRLL